MAHQRCEHDICHQINQVQCRDLMDMKAKALDHHKPCEDHKNLSAGASSELQTVIQQIAAPEDDFSVLSCRGLKLRVGQQTKQRDQNRKPA